MPKTPTTPTKQSSTRDQRLQIYILDNLGYYSHPEIARRVHLSLNQIQYALAHRITPQKHLSGRKPLLNDIYIDILIHFISASKQNRRMTFLEVSTTLN